VVTSGEEGTIGWRRRGLALPTCIGEGIKMSSCIPGMILNMSNNINMLQ